MRVSPITLVSFPVTCSALIGSLKLTGNELAKNVYQNVKDVSTFQRKCEKNKLFRGRVFCQSCKRAISMANKTFSPSAKGSRRDPGANKGQTSRKGQSPSRYKHARTVPFFYLQPFRCRLYISVARQYRFLVIVSLLCHSQPDLSLA